MLAQNNKILIVEDSKSWQENLLDVLGPDGEGHDITLAVDSTSAIAHLGTEQFDLIIIDLMLPESAQETKPGFQHAKSVINCIAGMNLKPRILIFSGEDKIPLDITREWGELSIAVASKSESLTSLLGKIRQLLPARPKYIVMKFGGTSMGTPESIGAVANIIVRHMQTESHPCTVVVSAMSKITDGLLAGAREARQGKLEMAQQTILDLRNRHEKAVSILITDTGLREQYLTSLGKACDDLWRIYQGIAALAELNLRSLDRVASYGERLSAPLLATTLEERGMRSISIDTAEEDLIITDDIFGSASPLFDKTTPQVTEKVVPLLERGVIPVITGFAGRTADGVPTTLGRGGSDYTATILGDALDAKEVWIWSDVSGIKNADPNLVPHAKIIPRMSYEKAAELTYYGAKVLYHKALTPIMDKRIPLRCLNTFAPDDPGTVIGPFEDADYEEDALISSSGLALITVGCNLVDSISAIGARTLAALTREEIDVMGYSQGFSQRTASITLREGEADRAIRALRREFKEESVSITPRLRVSAVSIITGKKLNSLLAGSFLAALGKAGIETLGVIEVPTENGMSVLVDQDALRKAVVAVSAVCAITDGSQP